MTDVKSSSGGWESMRSSVGILLGIGSVGDSPLYKLNDLCKIYEDAQKDIEKYDVDNVINFEHPNKKSTYDALYDDFRDLYEYTSVAHDLVAEHIDEPFYKKIDEFVEDLSNLSISNYATKNTIGTKERKLTEVGYRTYKETQVVKDKISIDDLFDNQSILGKQLQADYDLYEKEFSGKKSDKLKYEEYKSASLHIGGFDYKSIREKQESKELWVNIGLAVVTVAVSIVCPPAGVALGITLAGLEMSSAATGKDWISGRELSTSERWTRFGLAGLSVVLEVGAIKALGKGTAGLKLGASKLDDVDDVVKTAKGLGKGKSGLEVGVGKLDDVDDVVKGAGGLGKGASGLKSGVNKLDDVDDVVKTAKGLGKGKSGLEVGTSKLDDVDDVIRGADKFDKAGTASRETLESMARKTLKNSDNLSDSTKSVLKDILDNPNSTKKQLKAVDDLAKKLDDAPKIEVKNGINQEELFKTIEDMDPNISPRPDSSTYLKPDYIQDHLKQFDEGVIKIQSSESLENAIKSYGPNLGDPATGTFVMPKDFGEEVIKVSGGDPRIMEELLGLDKGELGETPIRIDFDSPKNAKVPSGNEAGSRWNEQWRPGGETWPGGIPEAVIDQVSDGKYHPSFIN